MTLEHIYPSAEDFERYEWQETALGSEERECRTYAAVYAAKARDAETAGDTAGRRVFALLHRVCSLELMPHSPEAPFVPSMVLGDRRTSAIEDFDDDHLACLHAIVPTARDPELRARIADVLWCRRVGGHEMAELAVGAYLESAEVLEDPEDWSECAERIRRALNLAASLGKTNQPFRDVVAHIEAVLDRYLGEDPLFLSATLMEMLQDHGEGDSNKYAALAEKAALRSESEETGLKWHKAREYWSVKSRWHVMESDEQAARECQVRVAETYVKEAEDRLDRAPGSYSVAARSIQQAIECLRRLKDTKDRSEELHKKLLDYQKKSVEHFESHTFSTDVSGVAREAAERVRGKSLAEAVFALALIASPPRVDEVRKRVQDYAGKFVFTYFLPTRILHEDGRVVATRPSIYGDEEQAQRAIRAEMFKEAANQQSLIAQAVIQPAVAQILREHAVSLSDMLSVLAYSPFVPPGREQLFARGIHAGLNGDLVAAVHLLCPQVEHSIRHLLSQRGVVVSGLDEQGVQDMHSLTTNLYKPELLDIFGKDIVFDLQGSLVERFGSNLRNRVAHGLMHDAEFYSWNALYFWWLVLRLCLAPLYALLHAGPDSSEADERIGNGTCEGRT